MSGLSNLFGTLGNGLVSGLGNILGTSPTPTVPTTPTSSVTPPIGSKGVALATSPVIPITASTPSVSVSTPTINSSTSGIQTDTAINSGNSFDWKSLTGEKGLGSTLTDLFSVGNAIYTDRQNQKARKFQLENNATMEQNKRERAKKLGNSMNPGGDNTLSGHDLDTTL
jgi:hypothetical protein